jgi:phosphoribosyl-ATP pyrophosphohydrolase/phosphoribosyl-AMP cyclohydrolase
MAIAIPESLVLDANGLLPVVIQDRASGDVLMVAWANAEALERTAATGVAHFWSRRREALWRKGETSGHELRVVEARADCDRDTLLLVVEPTGPACHTGARTCFGDTSPTAGGMLEELARVVAERARARADESYTARLLAKGPDQVLKKIGEEATEVVLAARVESDARLAEESADLLYHLLVALHQRGLLLARVMDELRRRMSPRARPVETACEGSAGGSVDPSGADATARPQDDKEG